MVGEAVGVADGMVVGVFEGVMVGKEGEAVRMLVGDVDGDIIGE